MTDMGWPADLKIEHNPCVREYLAEWKRRCDMDREREHGDKAERALGLALAFIVGLLTGVAFLPFAERMIWP